MTALIVGPTLLIYVVVLGLTMRHLQAESRDQMKQETTRLAEHYAAQFDGYLRRAAAVAEATASFVETHPDITESQLFTQLRQNLANFESIYGGVIAFEPGTFRSGDELFAPYVYRGGSDGAVVEMIIDRNVYDWYDDPYWTWFRRPKAEAAGIWTEPYFDQGAGGVLMVTYATPFHRGGEFRGVATVDIEVQRLNETVGENIVGDNDFYVLTRRGQFIYSSNSANIGRNVFDTAEEQGRPDIAALARAVVSGETGLSTVSIPGTDGDPDEVAWAFYAPIESTGWVFGSGVSEDVALAPVRRQMAFVAAALAVTLALIVSAILFVSGYIVRPIKHLRESVVDISAGDLDARIEGVDSRDEIGDLATSFNRMTADLRANVDRLAGERAARDRIERDLDLARDIQQGLLPKDELKIPGFEVAGWNQAADKTGGDYFDWFALPDGRFGIVLADVTGHGIGPALIAAVCRAYIRASQRGDDTSVAQVLERVNHHLKDDIPSTHFVTAVFALIEPGGPSASLISAGHGPLLFYEAETGTLHSWNADHPPLAVIDGVEFPDPRIITWKSGDMLVLLTDGFFEWANPEHEMYGTARLREFVSEHHAMAPADLIGGLYESVLAHARGTEQNDDLTAVVIKKS